MRFWMSLAIILCLLPFRRDCCQGQTAPVMAGTDMKAATAERPVTVTIPSEAPGGNPVDDQIWFEYYRAAGSETKASPAVVMLHPLALDAQSLMRRFARYLARGGIHVALMEMPYHRHRRTHGMIPGWPFIEINLEHGVQAYSQAASDVSTIATWLSRQPGVDPNRLGVVGTSLGAIVAHLSMGKDPRLNAGVAILGAGDYPDLLRTSLFFRFRHVPLERLKDPKVRAKLASIDPLTYANQNRPRRVLMIQAARDLAVTPSDAEELWHALGEPPIRWIDTNHGILALFAGSVFRAASAYLHSVWDAPGQPVKVPAVYAPTVKLGMLVNMDSAVNAAITWQAYTFIHKRNHLSLLHTDLGWSGRGPFVGLAATANQFIDLGVGRRLFGHTIRPYASFHIVF